jgi:uncharacterized protein (TIGR03066 family)
VKSLLLCLGCVVLSGAATFAAFEFVSPVRVPAAMRGKWVVREGKDLKGATLEFFADGRMVGIVQNGGREVTLNGRVEVQGNRFRVTTSDPGGGVLVTEAEEILDLTERYFVVQDPHGEVLIMERPPAVGLTSGGAR